MTAFTRFPVYFASMLALGLVLLAPCSLEAGSPKTKYQVLYSFQASPDGAVPKAGPIGDAHGNLYGTTFAGGVFSEGTVWTLDPNGQETVLYSFGVGSDACMPTAPLVQDSSGNLYGTTFSCGAYGGGTVFKVDTNGVETVLYSFCPGGGMCVDGAQPQGALLLDATGNLYGTTYSGGGHQCDGFGDTCGTVFKLDTSGTETVLHSFTGGADGYAPLSSLILDAASNLYGTTTLGGGKGCGGAGCGTVFKLDAAERETVLYSFKGSPDGSFPSGALTWDAEGNLYGATPSGGNKNRLCHWRFPGCGTIFKLASSGKETVLYRSPTGPGQYPGGTLIHDSAGNLYGTSTGGLRRSCCGLLFKLSKAGKLTQLHRFGSGGYGVDPTATLFRDPSGDLYGTTTWGGNSDGCDGNYGHIPCGVIFKLTP